MMVDLYDVERLREAAAPISEANLRTGEGHGHFRPLNRERPEKNAQTKKRKRAKISKTSRKRNKRKKT